MKIYCFTNIYYLIKHNIFYFMLIFNIFHINYNSKVFYNNKFSSYQGNFNTIIK